MPNLNHINRAPPRGVSVPPSALPRLLTAADLAGMFGVHVATVWNMVKEGRIPAPIYPAARAPRWIASEVMAALEATRALPSEAKARRMSRRSAAQAVAA